MLMTALDRPAHGAARWSWFGIGYCPSHFGEILQGAFHADDATVRRGLVTMSVAMGEVQQEYVTSVLGCSPSALRFAF